MKRLFFTTAAAVILGTAAYAQTANLEPDPVYTTFKTPGAGETSFDFELKGYIFGLRMIKARYMGKISETEYEIYSDMKTSGLAKVVKKLRIWAISEGRHDKTGLYPERHTQQNQDKKSRRVEMDYDYKTRLIDISINPMIGSQGVPPASPKERFDADDTLSGILKIMMGGSYRLNDDVCDGTVRVFDSKQHYGLRMEKAGTKRVKFDGEKVDTLRCHVYYEPISGFDPEDLPDEEEGSTPFNVYLMQDKEAGLHIPVRMSYKISSFKVVIKLDELRIENGLKAE